jgi:hypothetical protein
MCGEERIAIRIHYFLTFFDVKACRLNLTGCFEQTLGILRNRDRNHVILKIYYATTSTCVDDPVSSACIECESFAAAAHEQVVAVGRQDDDVVIDTCYIVIDALEMKAERSSTRSIEIIARV